MQANKSRKMKSRKRKRETSRDHDPVPHKNCITERSVTNIDNYETLIQPNKQRCEFCEMVLKNRYDSLIHTARHIIIPLIKQTIHVCKECLFCFTSQQDLENHRKCKHPNQLISDIIEKVVRTQLQIQCENLNLNIDKRTSCSNEECTVIKPGKKQVDTNTVSIEKRKEKNQTIICAEKKPSKPEVKESRQESISGVDNTILKTMLSSSPIILNSDVSPAPKKFPEQPLVLQPAYLFPQHNGIANQMIMNPIFQIQPLPPVLPQFGFPQLPQPFITMLVNTPQKPSEEEFILPDLEPSKQVVPSRPEVEQKKINLKRTHLKPILKSTEGSQDVAKNKQSIKPVQSLLKHSAPIENTVSSDALKLLKKSPLLIKQLLMKSPKMTGSSKNRIIFEDDLCQDEDDDVICVTDLQPTNNQPNTPLQNSNNAPVIMQQKGACRLITIENGHVTQEFQKNEDIPSLTKVVEKCNSELIKDKPVQEPVNYNKLIQPGMFRCKQCPRIFPNRFDAIVHEATHLTIKTYIKGQHCPSCDYYIHWSRVMRHNMICKARTFEKPSICIKCSLKYIDKARHDMIYHSIYKCSCHALFTSHIELKNHVELAVCNAYKVVKLCEVCEVFVTRHGTLKYEVVSVAKEYGKKYKCTKCGSSVDQVTNLRINRRVYNKKHKLNDFNRNGDKRRVNVNTNEKRLKSIQKRLKNITHMSKF